MLRQTAHSLATDDTHDMLLTQNSDGKDPTVSTDTQL